MMSTFDRRRSFESFGASVRGPSHRADGRANEDAWLHATGSFGHLIVVCDGLGSASQASIGSKAACRATHEAIIRWNRSHAAPLSYLPALINLLWRLRIHPISPDAAATTCLFALARPTGSWVLGGVGDGMMLVSLPGGVRIIMGRGADAFANETASLASGYTPETWALEEIPSGASVRAAILATDGVSDDLIPDQVGPFGNWLATAYEQLDSTERHRALASELHNWPTPHHVDDKTIAVLRSVRTGEHA